MRAEYEHAVLNVQGRPAPLRAKSYGFTGVDVPQPAAKAHKQPSVLLCAVPQM